MREAEELAQERKSVLERKEREVDFEEESGDAQNEGVIRGGGGIRKQGRKE